MVCRAAAAVYRRHGTNLNLREPVMTADPLAIRDGEAAIELPDKFDAGIYYIGRIRTPWTQPETEECPKNPRESRDMHHRSRPALRSGAGGRGELFACPCSLLDGPGEA